MPSLPSNLQQLGREAEGDLQAEVTREEAYRSRTVWPRSCGWGEEGCEYLSRVSHGDS